MKFQPEENLLAQTQKLLKILKLSASSQKEQGDKIIPNQKTIFHKDSP